MDDAADRDQDAEKDIPDPEQESIEHTEETGEITPPDTWPKGDPDVKIPT